jgi:hypothetical protein
VTLQDMVQLKDDCQQVPYGLLVAVAHVARADVVEVLLHDLAKEVDQLLRHRDASCGTAVG